jgi:hypothetical protein
MPALLEAPPPVEIAAEPVGAVAEFEALLIRAAQSVCQEPRLVTAADAIRELAKRRADLRLEMVGATTQLDNPPDRIKQQVRRQRKRGGSFKPVKRLKSARLRPCASDAHALDVRIKALVRIAREIAHPRPLAASTRTRCGQPTVLQLEGGVWYPWVVPIASEHAGQELRR